MAQVVKYFAVTAAGDGTGDQLENPGTLHSAGTWNADITGATFGAGSGITANVLPGTYTITAALAVSGTPALTGPLIVQGCKADGTPLTKKDVINPSTGRIDPSKLPRLNLSDNTLLFTAKSHMHFRFLRVVVSTNTNAILVNTAQVTLTGCVVEPTGTGTSAVGVNFSQACAIVGCEILMAGASYRCGILGTGSASTAFRDTRVEGNGATATSGNRHGIELAAVPSITGCTVVGFAADGIRYSTAMSQAYFVCNNNTICGNGAHGINFATAPTAPLPIANNVIYGNGGYGITPGTSGALMLSSNAMGQNTSGNIQSNPAGWPDGIIAATSGDFVSPAGNDYRLKGSSSLAAIGVGAGVAGGGGSSRKGSATMNHLSMVSPKNAAGTVPVLATPATDIAPSERFYATVTGSSLDYVTPVNTWITAQFDGGGRMTLHQAANPAAGAPVGPQRVYISASMKGSAKDLHGTLYGLAKIDQGDPASRPVKLGTFSLVSGSTVIPAGTTFPSGYYDAVTASVTRTDAPEAFDKAVLTAIDGDQGAGIAMDSNAGFWGLLIVWNTATGTAPDDFYPIVSV